MLKAIGCLFCREVWLDKPQITLKVSRLDTATGLCVMPLFVGSLSTCTFDIAVRAVIPRAVLWLLS